MSPNKQSRCSHLHILFSFCCQTDNWIMACKWFLLRPTVISGRLHWDCWSNCCLSTLMPHNTRLSVKAFMKTFDFPINNSRLSLLLTSLKRVFSKSTFFGCEAWTETMFFIVACCDVVISLFQRQKNSPHTWTFLVFHMFFFRACVDVFAFVHFFVSYFYLVIGKQ